MDEYMLERFLPHEFFTHGDHPGYPEEDDVVASDQHTGGIPVFQFFRLIRPAERGERPQAGAEPGVQAVFFLMDVGAAAFGAYCQIRPGSSHFSAVVAVPDRNPVAPPDLPGNAPVMDVFHPLEIGIGESAGDEFRMAFGDTFDGSFCQRFHLYEPLGGYHGFHHMVAALAVAYRVGSIFDLHQKSHVLQILDDVLPAFVPVFPFIFAGFLGHLPVQADDYDLFQVVPLSYFIVIGVMSRSDLHSTGTEFQVHIFIGDDGDFPVRGGQCDFLPDQAAIPFILGIHGYGRIPGDGFRTAGSDGQVLVFFPHDGIFDVPQSTGIILVFHFHIGKGRAAVDAPVDHPGAFVDQALFIKAHESFPDRPAQALVHGEPLPVPVAGNPQAFQLADDFISVSFLPLPNPFH